jgi:uncharacterized protein (DUF427 family)
MKAQWNGAVLAQSENTIVIEGNHYFPPDSINPEFYEESTTHSTCAWKGEANYYTISVQGEKNLDAAWYYPHPKEGSNERVGKDYSNYVAFWRGVEVTA